MLSCSFKILQRPGDSSGWMSRNLGGPECLHSPPRSGVVQLRGCSNASFLARPSQHRKTSGVCRCLWLNPAKPAPAKAGFLHQRGLVGNCPMCWCWWAGVAPLMISTAVLQGCGAGSEVCSITLQIHSLLPAEKPQSMVHLQEWHPPFPINAG